MKKPIIAFAALLVAAGASVGAFLAVKNKKDNEDTVSSQLIADNVLFSFDPNAVTKIDFNCDDGLYTAEYDSESETWSLTNRDDFALDQVYMQYICTYTSTLTAETSYGEADSEKKAMYGLDDPESITVYEPDGEHSVYIGDMSPTGDYYYVMTADKNNIYAINSLYGSVLKASRLMLKNKEFLPYTAYNIQEIKTIKNGEVTCDLTYDASSQTWSLPEEYSQLTFDQTAVSAIVNNIVRIEAEEMLDENLEDLSKYGFDDPEAEVIVKGIDGTERRLLISLFDDNPTYSYVLKENDNQVELYYTADMSFIDKTAYDYILQNVTSADIYSITGFELSFGDVSDTCTISMKENICEFNGSSADFENSSVYTAFQNYYNSFTILNLTAVDAEVQPELTDPALTAIYHFDDSDDITVDLVDNGSGGYYVFRNGSYTGAVAGNELDGSRTSLTEFRNTFIDLSGIE